MAFKADNSIDKRRALNRGDLLLITVLLLAALLWLWLARPPSGGRVCYVVCNGKEAFCAPLDVDQVFSVEGLPQVVFEVRDGQAAFICSDCPDQVCVRTGFIGQDGQTAACLPNRALLRIQGEPSEGGADTVTW